MTHKAKKSWLWYICNGWSFWSLALILGKDSSKTRQLGTIENRYSDRYVVDVLCTVHAFEWTASNSYNQWTNVHQDTPREPIQRFKEYDKNGFLQIILGFCMLYYCKPNQRLLMWRVGLRYIGLDIVEAKSEIGTVGETFVFSVASKNTVVK